MDIYICKNQPVSTKIAFIKAEKENVKPYLKEIILTYLKLNNLSLKKPYLLDKYIKLSKYIDEVACPLKNGTIISFIPVKDGISVELETAKMVLTKTN